MNKKNVAIAAAMLALIVGAGWALGYFDSTDPEITELQKLRDETFDRREQMSDEERRASFEQFREQVDKLTEDQRRQFFESGRERFQQAMVERMDRFFEKTPKEQEKELDEMIDRMEEWRKNRGDGGGARGGPGGGGRNQSPAARDQRNKERLDRSTPEMRAKMDRFITKMNERREERGLEPVGPGRGMFGGGGGRRR